MAFSPETPLDTSGEARDEEQETQGDHHGCGAPGHEIERDEVIARIREKKPTKPQLNLYAGFWKQRE